MFVHKQAYTKNQVSIRLDYHSNITFYVKNRFRFKIKTLGLKPIKTWY